MAACCGASWTRWSGILAKAGGHGGAGPAAVLPAERILYVGGRPGCLERMRACLDTAAGELLRHDGGRHDHPSLLAGLISPADRVAFPVDCVSHDAALTVKRLRRQLGKGWLPLRSAGLAPAPDPTQGAAWRPVREEGSA